MLVGLYILMGMGLNLEVGLAGLLDLGFVAFFAVGAYTHRTADGRRAACACASLLLGGDADCGPPFDRRRRAVRPARARCARRLSGGRDDGPGRDRARHRAVGLCRAAARRRAGHPANPQAATGIFRARQSGRAVLPDAGRVRGRRLCRLASGEFPPRPRLDGVARRRGRGAGTRASTWSGRNCSPTGWARHSPDWPARSSRRC